QHAGEAPQGHVPRQVSAGVVVLLEVVRVHQEEGQGRSVAADPLHLVLYPILEVAEVVEAGQAVEDRGVLRLLQDLELDDGGVLELPLDAQEVMEDGDPEVDSVGNAGVEMLPLREHTLPVLPGLRGGELEVGEDEQE